MAEQRYHAVLAVISDGLSISQVAGKVGVSRQTVNAWLARYEAEGLEGLKDRSHRPERVSAAFLQPQILVPTTPDIPEVRQNNSRLFGRFSRSSQSNVHTRAQAH